MAGQVYYPESFSHSEPIYRLTAERLSSGPVGESYEIVYSHDDLAPSGPDLEVPADFAHSWSVMLKDTFEWVDMQWAVIQQASTEYGHLEVIAAQVNGEVIDYFARASLTQAPIY